MIGARTAFLALASVIDSQTVLDAVEAKLFGGCLINLGYHERERQAKGKSHESI